MLIETAPESTGARILRRALPIAVAGMVSVSLITGYAMFFLLKTTLGVRATPAEELEGLGISEHDLPAYGDD